MSSNRVRVYVDGFNLYYGMHAAFGRQYLWLDLEALALAIVRPPNTLDRVRYFTAKVRNDLASEQRQDTYLQALAAHSGRLDIVEGRFQLKRTVCRSCGASRVSYEEKETDVSIAVTLVEDAATDRYDTAIVVSGDSDLCPALRAAKRLSERRILVVFPPRRQSDPLRAVADGVLHIDRRMLHQAQLPSTVVTPEGIVLDRPDYWSAT
jgi:uncharacterized LabA/DUF88 family protein